MCRLMFSTAHALLANRSIYIGQEPCRCAATESDHSISVVWESSGVGCVPGILVEDEMNGLVHRMDRHSPGMIARATSPAARPTAAGGPIQENSPRLGDST
jgi:hypothetical protein